jgi:hypothetical protein
MQHRRLALLLTALLIFTLVLSACGPRPQQGELAQSATDDTLVVDLPAVYIDYDETGQATISGASVAALGALLGQDLSSLNRSPEAIQKLTDAGVQNMFVNLTPAGVSMYANGNPMLSLAWTPESLASLGNVLGAMPDPTMQQVQGLVPLLSNMSLGIVMRFPHEGEELPLVAEVEADPQGILAEATRNAPAALQAVLPENMQGMAGLLGGLLAGLPPLTITFDANGAGTLTGLAPFIASQIPPGAIAMPADTLTQLQDLGITQLQIKNSPEGLDIAVNGEALPSLRWDRNEMKTMRDIGVNAGGLQALANLDQGTLDTLKTVFDAMPILQAAKLDVTINIPS